MEGNIIIYPSKFDIGQTVSVEGYDIKEGVVIGKRQHYENVRLGYDGLEFACWDYDIIYFDEELGYMVDTYSEKHLR